MTSPPLVSIVIPAYNHDRYLREAIGSVLSQDYPHIELIVLDDGSTDSTASVLATYGDQFRWESQPNIGQSATLEKGWRIARGDVLGYLSADDRLEPNAVTKSVRTLLADKDTVACYCDFNLIDPDSRIVRRVSTPEFSYRDMIVNVTCPLGPGAFFLRSAYEKSGPWDHALRQMPDYDFWLRLGVYGKFVRLPEVLADFRVHESSQTFSCTSPERAAEPVLIIDRLLMRDDLSPDLAPYHAQARANARLVSAQLHLRAGRFASGVTMVMDAYRSAPAALFSLANLHRLLNAAFNRPWHWLYWRLRSLLLCWT